MTVPTLDRAGGDARPAPGRFATANSTPTAAARNRSRVVLGALVVVVSALVAGLLYADAGDREPVLAVARTVEVGQVLAPRDVREVLAGAVPGVRTVPAAQRSSVVGRPALVRLVPGALLHPAQLGNGEGPAPGLAVVGALLRPGQYPIGLRPGDEVLALRLIDAAAGIGSAAPVRATVAALGAPAAGGMVVSLATEPSDAAPVAAAGAAGHLALVVAPR